MNIYTYIKRKRKEKKIVGSHFCIQMLRYILLLFYTQHLVIHTDNVNYRNMNS